MSVPLIMIQVPLHPPEASNNIVKSYFTCLGAYNCVMYNIVCIMIAVPSIQSKSYCGKPFDIIKYVSLSKESI